MSADVATASDSGSDPDGWLDVRTVERIVRYNQRTPDASIPEILGRFHIDPAQFGLVAQILQRPTDVPPEPAGADVNPTTLDDDAPTDERETTKYDDLFAEAQERAGVEWWEIVPEPALRDVFDDHGLSDLLRWRSVEGKGETCALLDVDSWRHADLSEIDELDADNGWYHARGDEPRPDVFRRFHDLLMADAPDGYEPYYFRVVAAGKAPATTFGSWKADDARLSVDDAIEWMKQGGNVGIAGTFDDELVNLDVDDDEETTPADHPATLRARSRSRTGYHGWFFDPADEVPNIPTDTAGEIRATWQYVVAPGSFVASAGVEIPAEFHDDDPGYYTIEQEAPVARIGYDDLPPIFRRFHETVEQLEREREQERNVHNTDYDLDLDGDSESRSSVFDVDARDVVLKVGGSTDPSARFSSAFHGSSTSANMSLSDEGKIQCWRHNVAHGGLQALAVLSGESPHTDTACRQIGAGHKNSGAGRNAYKGDPRLVLWAWLYAKRNGYIPDDDPMPRTALAYVAVETGVCDDDDVTDGWKLPLDAYNEAIPAVRETYDVDPGREPIDESERGGVPAVAVPFDELAELNDDDARELLHEQGVEWPDTRDARRQLRDQLLQAFRAGQMVVLDAPTALGKSHTVASESWTYRTSATDDSPVVHLSLTRDARDECIEASRQAGVTAAALKGRKDRCPVARGDHDPADDGDDERDPDVVLTMDGIPASTWIDRQCDGKANPFQLAHAWIAEHNDQGEPLPCSEGDADCPAMTQWEGVPRDDDGKPSADVIHATHPFAYVLSLRLHTNVVIDEAPTAFTVGFEQERIRNAVNAYLDAVNAPVKTYEALVSLAETDAYVGDTGIEREVLEGVLGNTPEREWYVEHPNAHALAPDLTRAIYRAIRWEDPDTNGRRSTRVIHEPPRFDDDHDEGFGGNFLTVVIDDTNTVRTVRHVPDFSIARSVVGLDAHPCEPLWQRTAGPKLSCEPILDDEERRLWRRFERGLTVVQVGDATRPLSGDDAPEWFANDWKLDVFMRRLHDRYGDEWRTAITAAASRIASTNG
ncbi:bifunctional DNA primase/polymerase [Halalkalicoccus salilacus]|uniref:bifunctional DNA primase/polymerase n=1 Tax=Halalkalicoccus sp. GCM10025704 TaxID=3252662 RepID=UPI00361BDDE4